MTLLRRVLNVQRRRKARQDLSAFAALIAAPGDLTAGVSLPANCELRASVAAVLAAPDVVINTSTGRDLGLPAGASGAEHAIGWFERGVELTKDAGAPGVVSVYVVDAYGGAIKIAEG